MEETIAAIATPPGEGGIGIVRISGAEALPILQQIFTRVTKKYSQQEADSRQAKGEALAFLPEQRGEVINGPIENRKLHYGYITDQASGEIIDEVMAVYMRGPHSYTAEDVVEIQCHGSIVSLRRILALTLRSGARLATPGEFTKRAFLNGRLDLSQAEAVIDLIRAKADRTYDLALNQLEGKFSREIKEIRSRLMDILVELTVNIDYPDEDIEVLTYEKLQGNLEIVCGQVKKLLATADTGRIMREGLKVAIIGKPNVGKSSLMNALLGESRAIVTEIPGTTRDTIEEAMTIRQIPVRLVDTAGIRKTNNVIEKIGIERSKASFQAADLILFMIDGSRPLDAEDEEIIQVLDGRKVIVLVNKADLGLAISIPALNKLLPQVKVMQTAVKAGEGLSQLEDEIEALVYGGKVKQEESMVVTNVRHEALLMQARDALQDGLALTAAAEPLEIIELSVHAAYQALGEIIGEAVDGDILDEVFSRFCLGK